MKEINNYDSLFILKIYIYNYYDIIYAGRKPSGAESEFVSIVSNITKEKDIY